jgi:hypothetical protein
VISRAGWWTRWPDRSDEEVCDVAWRNLGWRNLAWRVLTWNCRSHHGPIGPAADAGERSDEEKDAEEGEDVDQLTVVDDRVPPVVLAQHIVLRHDPDGIA